ncbi:hypothetical protein [Aeromicrobium sp.]|uniref:hypothetical protein n=1 Tax=Aeromicrobium sp. TaxID=1871063 RepID=UPI00199554BA|nr:hypothetical protein [Aeromicrobium sp.]MBC7631067.1 hypothetical protein [Aeromicrobium sp.]
MTRALAVLGLLSAVIVGGLVARVGVPTGEGAPTVGSPSASSRPPVRAPIADRPDARRRAIERAAQHQGQELQPPPPLLPDSVREIPPSDRPTLPHP